MWIALEENPGTDTRKVLGKAQPARRSRIYPTELLSSCCPFCCFSPFTVLLFHNCVTASILGLHFGVDERSPIHSPHKLLLWEL